MSPPAKKKGDVSQESPITNSHVHDALLKSVKETEKHPNKPSDNHCKTQANDALCKAGIIPVLALLSRKDKAQLPSSEAQWEKTLGRPVEQVSQKLANLKTDLGIKPWDSTAVQKTKLLKDLEENVRIMVLKSPDGPRVLNGNTRYYYAKKLGIPDSEIPVYKADGTKLSSMEDYRKLLATSNKPAVVNAPEAVRPRVTNSEVVPTRTTTAPHTEATINKPGATSPAPEPIAAKGSSDVVLNSPKGRIVGGALGALGIIGGTAQMAEGLKLIEQGKVSEGSIVSASGASNTTAGYAAILGFESVAMRAGGAGAILDGGLELYKGFATGNTEQQVEGAIKTTLGGSMFAGGPISAGAAAAYAGWSVGRFIGSNVGWGGETIDQKTTGLMDNSMNAVVNQNLAGIEQRNLNMLEKQKEVFGKTLEEIKTSGKTSKDISEAIIGLREAQERSRTAGNLSDAAKMQDEVIRLYAIRSQMAS